MTARPIRLLRSFATVGGWTMASRVLGFGRDILIAAFLGAGPAAEAFFVAFRLPNMFRRLFAEGAFNMAFVPLFAKKLEGDGPDAARVFKVLPRVFVDNKASNTHTVIEVNGRDRPGLLYDLTGALSKLNLQISSAKVSTYGERAVDVFYVKNVFGMKVDHPDKLQQIDIQLHAALLDPAADDDAARPAPARKVAAAT